MTSPTTCGNNVLTFGQERLWYSKLYADTAQKACENAVYYSSYKGTPVTANLFGDGTGAGCQLQGQSGNWTVLWLGDVPREAMCERTPIGPYTNMGQFGIDGGSFSQVQRDNIRNTNWRTFGDVRSDAGPARPPAIPGEKRLDDGTPIDLLGMNSTLFGWENDMIIPYIDAPTAANVDHIIPRKDKFGCDCGPSSYANALVISWTLNNKMTNNSQDSDRQAILDRWTLPPPPASPPPPRR